jgi:immunity protein 50 of polymorphic toxin system
MIPNIPGADLIVAWFGRWPSFHDAEIMSFHIDRERRSSSIRIRTWILSDRTDSAGRFIRERDAVVVFEFTGIRSLRIHGEDTDNQNVISSLVIEQTNDGYRLVLGPSYGMAGEMVVKDLSVRLETTFQP